MVKKIAVGLFAIIGVLVILAAISYVILVKIPGPSLFDQPRAELTSNSSSFNKGNHLSFMAMPAAKSMAEGVMARNDASSSAGERMIIKRVYVTLLVKSPSKSMDKVAAIANQLGGFVVSSNLQNSADQDPRINRVVRATITLRVPTLKLNDVLARLHKLSIRVISEDISGQDVTADYIDQQSRLKNLEAAETKLKEIMDKATRSRDVLAAYSEIVKIRGQIDQVKGRIKYYTESVNLSSVTVNFKSEEQQKFVSITSWKMGETVKSSLKSLVNALNSMASFMLRFIFLYLPVIVVCCVPLLVVVWIIRLLRRN